MNHIQDIQNNPLKAVFLLSIPIIAIFFLDTLYSVVDAYWISGLGESAIIAVGYVLNIWYALQKLGDGIGRSCNILVSTSFGAKDYERANDIAFHGLVIILILSVIFPLIFILTINQICVLSHLEQYSLLMANYFSIPSVFIVFVMLTNFFSSLLGSEGDTKRAAYVVMVGNLINIILDPVLIYRFNFGILGAGIATTIGCLVSFLLFYYLFYVRGDVVIKLNRRHFSCDMQIFKEIIVLAIPLVLNGFILMLLGLLINYSLYLFSTPTIAFGFVVLLRIQTLAFTPIQGVSQGVCIVTAHLMGAKRFKMLVITLKKSMVIILCFSFVFGMIYLFSYHYIISFFTTSTDVGRAVANMVMFSVLSFFFQPPIRILSYAFAGLRKSNYSFLCLVLNVALFVVFMLIGTMIFKSHEVGVFVAISLADIVEVIFLVFLFQRVFGKIIRDDEASLPSA